MRDRASLRTHIQIPATVVRSQRPGSTARARAPGPGGVLAPTPPRKNPPMAQRFEGVIGDDWRTSTPWWPPDPRASGRRAERARARARRRRVRATRLLRVRHRDARVRRAGRARSAPHELPHHRAVLAHSLVPPDRAQPSPQRHGPRRRPRGRLSGLLGAHPARERLPLGDPARAGLCHVRGREVAPHARRRNQHGVVTRGRGRPGAASIVGTAFTAARPTSSCRTCITTTTRCSHLHAPRTDITSAPTWPIVRSNTSSDLRAVDAGRPFFLYLATGACHSPHHAPPEWIERYRGHFDAGWDAWREATFARQLANGAVRPGTTLTPRPPWVPAWDTLKPEDQAVAARFMECFAAYLSYTDAQIGRVLAYPRRDRRPRQHPRCRRLGQRRERGGR